MEIPVTSVPAIRRIAPVFLLALVSVAFYWRIALTDQYVWFDHTDMVYLELPRLQYEALEIHRGSLPLWDRYLFFGQPLIGGAQPGPLYPLNLLFCLLPLDNGFLSFRFLNWYWVLIHFQAALGAYLFLRSRRLGVPAALFGGLAFSYSGFFGSVPWLDVANGAVWIPVVLLWVWRAAEEARPLRDSALAGLALGIAWLSGHHELPLLLSLAAAGALAWLSWTQHRTLLRPLTSLAVFGLVTALISAVQILPMIEFGRLGVRWVGTPDPVGWRDLVPYTIHSIYSMSARDVLGSFILVGRQVEAGFFVGLVVLSLAAMGLMSHWNQRAVRVLAGMGICALIYAAGQSTVIHGLFYALIPMVGKARVPLRAVALAHFALAALAGWGLDALLRRTAPLRAVALALTLLGCAIVAGAGYRLAAAGELADESTLRAGFIALALAALLAAFRAGRLEPRAAALGVVLAAVIELSPLALFSSRYQENGWRFAGALHRNDDLAAWLRTQPGQVRVSADDTEFPENFGEWQGISQASGYTAGLATNLRGPGWHLPEWQNIAGVTHWLASKPARPDQVDMYEGRTGVHAWRNPGALPRAWLVHQTIAVRDVEDLNSRVRNPAFDPRRQAVLLGSAPPLKVCPAEQEDANVTGSSANQVTVQVRTDCTALLVLSETNYPGWRARIDGREAPILEVFGAFRGVVIGPRDSSVSFDFRPASVRVGWRLTLAGLVLVILLCGGPRAFPPIRATASRWLA